MFSTDTCLPTAYPMTSEAWQGKLTGRLMSCRPFWLAGDSCTRHHIAACLHSKVYRHHGIRWTRDAEARRRQYPRVSVSAAAAFPMTLADTQSRQPIDHSSQLRPLVLTASSVLRDGNRREVVA